MLGLVRREGDERLAASRRVISPCRLLAAVHEDDAGRAEGRRVTEGQKVDGRLLSKIPVGLNSPRKLPETAEFYSRRTAQPTVPAQPSITWILTLASFPAVRPGYDPAWCSFEFDPITVAPPADREMGASIGHRFLNSSAKILGYIGKALSEKTECPYVSQI